MHMRCYNCCTAAGLVCTTHSRVTEIDNTPCPVQVVESTAQARTDISLSLLSGLFGSEEISNSTDTLQSQVSAKRQELIQKHHVLQQSLLVIHD